MNEMTNEIIKNFLDDYKNNRMKEVEMYFNRFQMYINSFGYHETGDYVYKDEEGYFYFVSRHDDMIKTRGFRVNPYEIESVVEKEIKEIEKCDLVCSNCHRIRTWMRITNVYFGE